MHYLYQTNTLPEVEYPNCLQTTIASVLPNELWHTQPQTSLRQICKFPSQDPDPHTKRTAPVLLQD